MIATILTKMIFQFLQAFGVVIGASLMGGIASVLTFEPPSVRMMTIAGHIKIWAVVAAIGGTIDPFRLIESKINESQYFFAATEIMYILSAFLGASIGVKLVEMICAGGVKP